MKVNYLQIITILILVTIIYLVLLGARIAGQGNGLSENAFFRVKATELPEHSSLALLGFGLTGLAFARRRALTSFI
ncbi:MAG: hypothetical protein ACI8O8_000567 [Oleiphilaceae bacterium]|jgi:hypothetical protein